MNFLTSLIISSLLVKFAASLACICRCAFLDSFPINYSAFGRVFAVILWFFNSPLNEIDSCFAKLTVKLNLLSFQTPSLIVPVPVCADSIVPVTLSLSSFRVSLNGTFTTRASTIPSQSPEILSVSCEINN